MLFRFGWKMKLRSPIFLAIDYAPGNDGKSGQIIAFGADEVKVRFIAADIDDFLQQLAAGEEVLNNGFH